jgi:hypothetical protein
MALVPQLLICLSFSLRERVVPFIPLSSASSPAPPPEEALRAHLWEGEGNGNSSFYLPQGHKALRPFSKAQALTGTLLAEKQPWLELGGQGEYQGKLDAKSTIPSRDFMGERRVPGGM